MKISMFDRILLKDGREGDVMEVLGDGKLFFVDVGSQEEGFENIDVTPDQIEKVIFHAKND